MEQRPKAKGASEPVSVTYGTVGNKARLEVVQRVGGYAIRVIVIVDPSYANQSVAYAQVLNKDLEWTTLVEVPSSLWWDSVAWVKDDSRGGSIRITEHKEVTPALHELELDLFVRAAAILNV